MEEQKNTENPELAENSEGAGIPENSETAESAETAENTENSGSTEPKRSDENLMAAIEAMLFTAGESAKASRLAEALKIDADTFRRLMDALTEKYDTQEHGIKIIRLEDSYQMCTKQEFYPDLIRLETVPKKPVLTDVILETLSIIAYKQPVTKAEIERIRGVNSDHAVNRLVEYDLVRELGRLNAPGRPILFGTTEEFLRNFGVRSREDLPSIDTVRMEDFKAEAEEEAHQKVDV